MLQSYRYTAFGEEINPDENDTNPFRHNAEYFDTSSRLYYLRHRFYNPATGRFLNEDPIRWGKNWYCFAMQNPTMFIDPWGLSPAPGWMTAESGAPMWSGNGDVINLQQAVTAAGGTIDWNNDVATVHLWGVSVNFSPRMDGVTFDLSEGNMHIREDVFYYAMIREAGFLVFVGGRPVPYWPDALHASIQIFIHHEQAVLIGTLRILGVRLEPIYNGTILHATIGGFTANRNFDGAKEAIAEIGEPMVALINDIFDRRQDLIGMAHVSATQAQVISLFRGVNAFNNRDGGGILYNPIVHNAALGATGTTLWGYNSNGFVAGILDHARIAHPSIIPISSTGGFSGWTRPIPYSYFR